MNEHVAAYAQKIINTLTPHLGHTVIVQGHHHRKVTGESLRPDNAIMSYGGFVVECADCGGVSLSQQWN